MWRAHRPEWYASCLGCLGRLVLGVRYVWPKTVANGEQCLDLDDLDANVSQGQFDSLGGTKFIEIPHFAAGISMPVSHLHSRLSWCQRHCQIQSLEF